jgi:hypothetical protein
MLVTGLRVIKSSDVIAAASIVSHIESRFLLRSVNVKKPILSCALNSDMGLLMGADSFYWNKAVFVRSVATLDLTKV